MPLAQSKITAQGQTSIPLEVRRKLGVGPGSVLEWEENGETVVVRRSGRYTSEDVHRALFPKSKPTQHTLAELKESIRQNVKTRHARD